MLTLTINMYNKYYLLDVFKHQKNVFIHKLFAFLN